MADSCSLIDKPAPRRALIALRSTLPRILFPLLGSLRRSSPVFLPFRTLSSRPKWPAPADHAARCSRPVCFTGAEGSWQPLKLTPQRRVPMRRRRAWVLGLLASSWVSSSVFPGLLASSYALIPTEVAGSCRPRSGGIVATIQPLQSHSGHHLPQKQKRRPPSAVRLFPYLKLLTKNFPNPSPRQASPRQPSPASALSGTPAS
jgi:hypothetical protein